MGLTRAVNNDERRADSARHSNAVRASRRPRSSAFQSATPYRRLLHYYPPTARAECVADRAGVAWARRREARGTRGVAIRTGAAFPFRGHAPRHPPCRARHPDAIGDSGGKERKSSGGMTARRRGAGPSRRTERRRPGMAPGCNGLGMEGAPRTAPWVWLFIWPGPVYVSISVRVPGKALPRPCCRGPVLATFAAGRADRPGTGRGPAGARRAP